MIGFIYPILSCSYAKFTGVKRGVKSWFDIKCSTCIVNWASWPYNFENKCDVAYYLSIFSVWTVYIRVACNQHVGWVAICLTQFSFVVRYCFVFIKTIRINIRLPRPSGSSFSLFSVYLHSTAQQVSWNGHMWSNIWRQFVVFQCERVSNGCVIHMSNKMPPISAQSSSWPICCQPVLALVWICTQVLTHP